MNQKLSPAQLKTLEKLVAKTSKSFSPETLLFKEQLAFIRDPARFKDAVCTRRSGKSVACAVDLLDTAQTYPDTTNLYITLSRTNAKRIIWPILRKFNQEYELGGVENATEGSITFPNGSIIYIAGAKDKESVEKFRGLAIKKVYLDEAQSFPPFIEDLIDDVITPALLDHAGSLILIGTPGPIPSGYFYEQSKSPYWSHHFWSLFNNPHLHEKSGKDPKALLQDELARRGVEITDPRIQREFFGKWTLDLDSLVFKYSDACDYQELPHLSKPWRYVMGIDLGFNDADAIAILAYNELMPEAYLVSEVLNRKQDITDLMNNIQHQINLYEPDAIVIDTGGLGRKIAEELNKRYKIGVKAADKARKFENIELLNDALRTGKLRAKKDSFFAHDAAMVEWNHDKTRPDKLVISNRYHSDICDAVLYAFRELYHWMYAPVKPKVEVGSKEYFDAVETDIEAQLILQIEARNPPKAGLGDDSY